MRRKSYHRQPHLWRHANGVFYLIWTESGKARRRSTKTRKRVQAEEALNAFIQVQDSASWGVNLDITLHEAADQWIEEKEKPRQGLSIKTLWPYRSIVGRIKEFFPKGMRAAEVAPSDVRRFLDFLESEYSLTPEGLKKRLGLLSMIFRFQAREGNLVRNPCAGVAPPKSMPKRTPAMKVEDFESLIATLGGGSEEEEGEPDPNGLRLLLRDLILVLWLSGLRSIEAYRLSWGDIDFDEKVWTIRSPQQKGGIRVEPIHEELLDTLKRLRLKGGVGPFAEEWPLKNEWRRFKQKNESWDGTSLHSLRHAFVTRLAKLGNPAVTKYLAGHHTDTMSDHYTHLGPEDVRESLNRI